MSDNEKLEKENEQFSSAVLYVATAVYVGVCAMVFGALYAKLPSLGEAFLTLMKDYGTILAGIPVLVAVVVAKQQLDANRRQHVATVKRGLRKEIEAIDKISSWTYPIKRSTLQSVTNDIFLRTLNIVRLPTPDFDELHEIEKFIPRRIYGLLVSFFDDIREFGSRTVETAAKRKQAEDALEELRDFASEIQDEADAHYRYLSQYWS
ncbi:hypothetical protein [Brucella intermedia]|uniref:hypothetical protein n=1 Tax=Brucella intermedia TaxID=94625 RepID=UPI0007C6DD65|nr:hypothetical protein [Brucella intermedia]OAE39700.1 hypothetical protein A7J42_14430 [Brucella intermedia]